ncbi:MAG: NADH-quinone oxidoreductase subunit NuoE [Eubacterium sp.]|nr:NADH-quinone oxidoreductase subunit NuoE [Eubacterium sp.]
MEKIMNKIKEIRENEGSMLDAFMAVQAELGYLAPEAITAIAGIYDTTEAQVYETASFYSYLYLEPVGKHVIRVCRSAPCCAAGALEVTEMIGRRLGIGIGETTEDGLFTLIEGECVGQCAKAPVITVDRKVYGPLTEELLEEIIGQYC